jgi:hypothetical protein
MSSDPCDDLETFVQRFLTGQGADIEKRGSRLDVLAPQRLAQLIGIPNFCSLTIGSQAPEGLAVHYGSPLLEKMAETACHTIPLTIVRSSFHYIKSQGFERLIEALFTFRGAIVRVENTAAVQTEYLLLTCHYLAQSDEQKEGLVPLAFNLETGAPIGNPQASLDAAEKEFETSGSAAVFGEDKISRIIRWVQRQAPQILETQIQSFHDSMNRRFRRDVRNLEEYYAQLRQEMAENLKRPGLSEQLIQERKEKIALLPDEMIKKKEDLFKKYSIRIKLQLCGAMLIRTPAVKLFCKATVGRRQKPLTLYYNPIDKSIDPLVCSGCGGGTYQVLFCDHLHLLCPSCAGKCPVCTPRNCAHP